MYEKHVYSISSALGTLASDYCVRVYFILVLCARSIHVFEMSGIFTSSFLNIIMYCIHHKRTILHYAVSVHRKPMQSYIK